MSNYHVLEMDEVREDRVRVAFHIDVPDETNAAGYSLRQALQDYLLDDGKQTIDSVVKWISQQGLADVQAGAVYEVVRTVKFDRYLSTAEKRDMIDAEYTALNAQLLDTLRARLKFWGLDRNV